MGQFVKGSRRERSSSSSIILALVSVLGLVVIWLVVVAPLHRARVAGSQGERHSITDKCTCSDGLLHQQEDGQKEVQLLKKMLLANADRKIAERRAWLSPSHSEGRQFGALKSEMFYYMFVPVLPCFWTFEKYPDSIKMHDGPKWTCGVQEVHQFRSNPNVDYNKTVVGKQNHYDDMPCIVYSMGSRGQFEFEDRIRTIAPGCEIHTFDPTYKEQGKGKDIYDAYHGDYGFGGKDSIEGEGKFPVKSLETIMKDLKHTHVDYLKADVEGYEWEFFSEVDWSVVKVGQILIELHPQKGRSNVEMTAWDMEKVFVKLEEAGFRLISLEPVTFTYWGQVEMVFMHKDWQPSGNW